MYPKQIKVVLILIDDIKDLQKEIDFRTEIENIAIELISECEFEKAIEILNII